MKAKYTCSKCGAMAAVLKGADPLRSCNCSEPIIAHMEAVLDIDGGLLPPEPKKKSD